MFPAAREDWQWPDPDRSAAFRERREVRLDDALLIGGPLVGAA